MIDSSGTVVERVVYDPYGKVTFLNASWSSITGSAYAFNFLHQGGRYETVSGLYHSRHRELDPELGRWLQLDPIAFSAGDSNLYRLVGNNSPSLIDPFGLQAADVRPPVIQPVPRPPVVRPVPSPTGVRPTPNWIGMTIQILSQINAYLDMLEEQADARWEEIREIAQRPRPRVFPQTWPPPGPTCSPSRVDMLRRWSNRRCIARWENEVRECDEIAQEMRRRRVYTEREIEEFKVACHQRAEGRLRRCLDGLPDTLPPLPEPWVPRRSRSGANNG